MLPHKINGKNLHYIKYSSIQLHNWCHTNWTSGVRTGYFLCLLEALLNTTGSGNGANPDLLKSIQKILDNASRQPAQVAIVTEAIHCCACYIKLNPEEVDKNTNEVMKVLMNLSYSSDIFVKVLEHFRMLKLIFCIQWAFSLKALIWVLI